LQTHRSEILQQVTFASAYTRLAGRLTILENLQIFGQLYQIPEPECRERIKDYLELFGLWSIRDRRAGVLSAGQTTRLMLAKAFLPNPKIVLLDEPTASLDPDVSIEIRKFILDQRKERKIAVLFTSHNMAEVEEICDRVLILKEGHVVANNTPHEIAASISRATVHLMFTDEMLSKADALLKEKGFYIEKAPPFIAITVEEDKIAALLRLLGEHQLDYTQIYIDKPSLEDYFIQVAHGTQGERR
jgi:ABC-2 type transport system ATP-binding protein